MGMLENIQSGRDATPPRIMIFGCEGVGKAQPLSAKVLAPTGFVKMGSIHTGDRVIGADGKAHNVLAVFPQGEKDVFRVTFRDGSETECFDDHLWFTQTRNECDMNYPGLVRSLRTIRGSLRYGTHFNHAIPRVFPMKFESNATLPISPFFCKALHKKGKMARPTAYMMKTKFHGIKVARISSERRLFGKMRLDVSAYLEALRLDGEVLPHRE